MTSPMLAGRRERSSGVNRAEWSRLCTVFWWRFSKTNWVAASLASTNPTIVLQDVFAGPPCIISRHAEQELHMSVGCASMATTTARSFRPTVARCAMYVRARRSESQRPLEIVQAYELGLDTNTDAFFYFVREHCQQQLHFGRSTTRSAIYARALFDLTTPYELRRV